MEATEYAEIQTAPVEWDNDGHPWRRYGARTIDLSLFSFLMFFAASIPVELIRPGATDVFAYPTLFTAYFIIAPLSAVATGVAVALCLARWGSTPGKWLFGLRVLNDGGKLNIREALRREANLLWWGVGIGIPLLSLGMMIRSYSEVENERQSRWDRQVGSEVQARIIEGWQYAGLVIGTLLVIALKVVDVFFGVAANFSGG